MRPCLSGIASAIGAKKFIRWIGVSVAVGLAIVGVSIAVCTAIGAVVGVAMNDMAAVPWGFAVGAALGGGIVFVLSMAFAMALAIAPALREAFRERH